MTAQTNAGPIRVAIVEDDDELRANLTDYIGRFPDFKLVSAYADGEAAVADLPRLKAEVVLMDINLPGLGGIECVHRLKDSLPRALFMMLTVYEDNDRLFGSLLAGASGYLLKRASFTEIVAAIRDLHAGGSPMTPQIARRIVQHYQQTQANAQPAEELGELTAHQRAFLEHLAKGYRYKEIADHLGISMEGVRSYVRRIYEKLHVHSRTEAVLKYLGR
jgi:DNA-binding NarL/FixJ family response regulator